ncbi:MAG: amidohydrolase family protein [Acidimicrobiia bacterium]|nr:amidohydrolase family protein [Acidimicrobiia bacterium]
MHNEHWDPFWRACSEEGTVVCLHIGSSSELVITSIEAPINVMISLQPMNIVQAAADIVWSRVMTEFPDLRIALSEGGIG